jgi:hypothetical protein
MVERERETMLLTSTVAHSLANLSGHVPLATSEDLLMSTVVHSFG